MKFIRKHTEGPWKAHDNGPEIGNWNHHEIQFGNDGECVAEIVHEKADADAISQTIPLLEYAIERAEYLSKCVDGYKGIKKEDWPMDCKYEKQELSRLLEIIRAAGVEVINE